MVGEKRPIVTSTSISSGGTQQSGYEYKDIGIELTVTPHINKKGFVVMEILQKINNVGGNVKIDGNDVPIITSREFGASISVNDRRTIVLGGLVGNEQKTGEEKIPFLGDIPLLGQLFRSKSDSSTRGELMVMITPYVLQSPQDVYGETARRFDSLQKADDLLRDDWSGSEMKKLPTVEQLRARELKQRRDELEIKASQQELSRQAIQTERRERRAAQPASLSEYEGITNITFKAEDIIPLPSGGTQTNPLLAPAPEPAAANPTNATPPTSTQAEAA